MVQHLRKSLSSARVQVTLKGSMLIVILKTDDGPMQIAFDVEETNELRAILCEDLAEQYGDAWD